MKKLYKNQKNSIYKIQKEIGVGKYTLYRYINGDRNIKKMPIKMILDIANLEKIEPNKLFKAMLEYQEKRDK